MTKMLVIYNMITIAKSVNYVRTNPNRNVDKLRPTGMSRKYYNEGVNRLCAPPCRDREVKEVLQRGEKTGSRLFEQGPMDLLNV